MSPLSDIIIVNQLEPDSGWDLVKDVVLNALGAFLGFMGAWLIYRKERADNAQKEKEDMMNRHREHLLYLQGILSSVVRFTGKQTELVDEFVQSVRNEPTTLQQLSLLANTSVQRLARTDTQELYHAYNTIFVADENRTQAYRRFLMATDAVALNNQRIQELYVKYLDSTKELIFSFKKAIEDLANDLSALLFKLKKDPNFQQNPHYQQLNAILVTYLTLTRKLPPMRAYYTDVIHPLKEYFLANPSDDSELMLRKLKDAGVILNNAESGALQVVNYFPSESMREAAEALAKLDTKLRLELNLPAPSSHPPTSTPPNPTK